MRVAQLQAIQQLELRFLTLADGGSLTLTAAPIQIRLSTQGNQLDMGAVTTSVQVFGNRGNDTIIGAGGAARSVIDALGGAGTSSIAVINRTPERAQSAAALAPSPNGQGPANRTALP